MAHVTLVGGNTLRRTLLDAGHDVKEWKSINKGAAEIAAEATRTAAPKRSWALARSIRAGATQRAGIVRVGGKKVPYANPIHWGWKARNIKANPFASRAAQASEPGWSALYKKRVKDILDDVKGI